MKEKNVVYLKKKLKMFKKGEVQFGLKQLIYLILSLIVLLLLLLVSIKLWGQFSGKVIDEASLNNYNNLVEEIELLMGDSKKTEIVMPYYVRGEITGVMQTYGLVGFVGEDLEQGIATKGYIKEACWTDSRIFKSMCGYSDACLCLIRLTDWPHDVEVLKCYKNKNITGYFVDTDYEFTKPYAGFPLEDLSSFEGFGGSEDTGGAGASGKIEATIIKSTNKATVEKDYSTLVIWGQCGISWGVRNIVIRKEKAGEDTYRIVFSNQESAGYEGCCCVEQNFVRGCEPEKCGDFSICDGLVDNKGYGLFYYQGERCEDIVSKPLGKCKDVKKEYPIVSDECCCVNPIQYNTGCTPKECKETACGNEGILLTQSCEDYGINEEYGIDEQYCVS